MRPPGYVHTVHSRMPNTELNAQETANLLAILKPPLDERMLFQVGKGSRAYRPGLIDPRDRAAVWTFVVIVAGCALVWAGMIAVLRVVL